MRPSETSDAGLAEPAVMYATEDQVNAILEAADIAELDYEQYAWVQDEVAHTLTARKAEQLLAWLRLRKEWSEADFLAPEFVKEELRHQKELDRGWREMD